MQDELKQAIYALVFQFLLQGVSRDLNISVPISLTVLIFSNIICLLFLNPAIYKISIGLKFNPLLIIHSLSRSVYCLVD